MTPEELDSAISELIVPVEKPKYKTNSYFKKRNEYRRIKKYISYILHERGLFEELNEGDFVNTKFNNPSREQLIEVFEDTQKWYQTDEILKEAIKNSISNTKIYVENDYPDIEKTHSDDINISVNKYRTFETAQYYKRKFSELKIAVLNFASATNVGGGVTKSSKAQEESLCRCSTLYPVLNTDENHKSFYEYHRNRHDSRYTDRCIYSPDIVIIKSDEDIPTRLPSDKWTKVDILTCAAPNLRPSPNNFMNLGKDKAVSVSDEELFKIHVNRGKHILTIAAHHKADILILGAFGAGAFMNNPYIVAKAYREILPQFNGYFKEIVFAIYCPPNRGKDNLIAFQKVFENVTLNNVKKNVHMI